MKERPILFNGAFNGAMARAILDGRKTQTRRVIKIDYDHIEAHDNFPGEWQPWLNGEKQTTIECPYGKPGDRLWVRETWKPDETPDEGHDKIGDAVGNYPPGVSCIRYRADDAMIAIENNEEAVERWISVSRCNEMYPKLDPPKWRPSIHMPRWACRLLLDVTSVRVERLQEISYEDVVAEGTELDANSVGVNDQEVERAVDTFAWLWNSINAYHGHGWDVNPWVWVIEFEEVKCS